MARLASSDLSKSESQVSFGDGGGKGGPAKPLRQGVLDVEKTMKNATENAGDSCFFYNLLRVFFWAIQGGFNVFEVFLAHLRLALFP